MASSDGVDDGSRYAALVDVNEPEIQNVQELATIWGSLEAELTEIGGEFVDAYTILGGRDFLLLFDAPDRDTALQISIAVERHGLDTETMELIPVEELGGLVEDI